MEMGPLLLNSSPVYVLMYILIASMVYNGNGSTLHVLQNVESWIE